MPKSSPSSTQKTTLKADTKPQSKVPKIVIPAQALVTVGESQARGFLDFLRTQGVVGLAVGLVLGGAVSVLVKSLVDNVIMPPIGLLLGSADGLKGLTATIGRAGNEPSIIYYGTFLNDLINFLVIALTVYLVFHALGLTKLDKKKA